ncbi:kunitz-type protease inhibitor 1-like [Heptranchias perlo]|uniref:kunitz-type protease inhibitor 1-like n=1 Tax=Heptranchias perlo TaxID=212740 RepID=UPI00355A2C04
MCSLRPGLLTLLPCLLYLLQGSRAIDPDHCPSHYTLGREDFVLDTDDSVSAGAAFLGSPTVNRARDCVRICCRTRNCNVVLLEDRPQESQDNPMLRAISGCFLFNCLYNQVYVCKFFRREGFSNFILDTVYEAYLKPREPSAGDKLPVANAGRDRIVQPNEKVTLSGLESRDDYKIVQFDWVLLLGDPSVKIEPTKNRDEVVASNLQVGLYVFQLTVTDTAGQKTTDNMTITVLSPEQSEEYCMADKKVGPCRGAFPRWRYAADKGTCEAFTYGGCKGNNNNYVGEKECKQACGGAKAETKNSGRSGLPHCTGECTDQQFKCTDNCCIDANLECDGNAHCKDQSDETGCTHIRDRFNKLLDIDIPKEKARCVYPPVTGRCRADFSRFYYNPFTKSCERFTYGGCDGNENRFEQEKECMRACRGVTEKDVFSRGLLERQEQEKSSNAGIAIAVVLAICIATVLAVLVYYLLKMKRQNRRQASPSGSNGSTVEEEKKLVAMHSKPI